MAIETFTHTYGNKIDETIFCSTKDEFDRIMMIVPQTFAGFEYTTNFKQGLKRWRIRVHATRKQENIKQPLGVTKDTQPPLPGVDMDKLEVTK